jgi:RNA polymerase sigma factor (sigma-70 family)
MLTMTDTQVAPALHASALEAAEVIRPEQLDDSSLIARCLAGDEAAWEALISRYQRLIYSIPIRYGMGEEVAADVFQAVSMRMLERLDTVKDRTRLGAWLIMTTRRECWRVSHRLRREAPIGEGGDDEDEYRSELVDDRPLVDDEMLQLEEQQRVREAVAALPERARELLELLFFAEDRPSYEEISRRLGMPVASIGPTRARALEKLRALLA